MRLRRAEWLLLPLLVFPLLLGGGSLAYTRGAYRTVLDHRRASPPEPHDWPWRALFASAFAPGAGDVEFESEGFGRGFVRLPGADPAPWRFSVVYPGGVAAHVFESAEKRLRAETRPTAVDREGSGDLFQDLWRAPDLETLRTAPLPAATKLFVARHAGDALPPWVVPLLERIASLPVPPLPPGIHHVGGTWIAMGTAPILFSECPSWHHTESLDIVALTLSTEPRSSDLWHGRLESPVAGYWSVESLYGDAWWHHPMLRRYGPLVGGVVVTLLGFVALVFVAMVRRRHADEARVRFLTEIAHDLRTPVAAVRMSAELLASGRAPEEKRAGYLDAMARETARLSGLIANLLDLARLERGARTFERESVLLADVAEEAARDFLALFPAREGDLRTEGHPRATATADRSALARCLANLLENAGKFTPEGTPITLAWAPGRIRVADEGPGIPPDERARLFRRYARGRGAAAAAVPGTGLGLSLVRELAQGMGGQVRLLDTSRGAAFELELPDG